MKINSGLLALCVFLPLEAYAFQTPKAFKPSAALRSSFATDFSEAAKIVNSRSTLGPKTSSPPTQGLDSRFDKELSKIWQTSTPIRVLSQTLRTWEIDRSIDAVQVSMNTEGRPAYANLELWHGPDYTPSKMKIYTEDGAVRPFNAVVATPMPQNTVALYNTGQEEFPLNAVVEPTPGIVDAPKKLMETGEPRLMQGGMISSFPLEPEVDRVQVLLISDGRNIKSRVELMHGPNNDKEILEFYSSDGHKRPFYVVIESPGSGNVIRVINQNTVEFPFDAYVQPY